MNHSTMADGPTTEDIFVNDGVEYSSPDETFETSDSDAEDPDDIYEPSTAETDQETDKSLFERLQEKKEGYRQYLSETPPLALFVRFWILVMYGFAAVLIPLSFFHEPGETQLSKLLLSGLLVSGIIALFFGGLNSVRNPEQRVGDVVRSDVSSDKIESESEAQALGLLAMGCALFGLLLLLSKMDSAGML
jgi:hypothetical protein